MPTRIHRLILIVAALTFVTVVLKMISQLSSPEPDLTRSSIVSGSVKAFVAVWVTHKRTHYLERSLVSFLNQRHNEKFDMIVSLDAPSAESRVRSLLIRLESEYSRSIRLVLKTNESKTCFTFQYKNEQAVDQHIFSAIRLAFSNDHSFGVIIEEDLELAPDFLDLMITSAPVLAKDQTLFCVSAWNDNGFKGQVSDPSALMRTDILPGLGFMLTRSSAMSLLKMWKGNDFWGWDFWMRRSVANDLRECIAPEIPRVLHIGEGGIHIKENSFYEKLMDVAKISGGLGTFEKTVNTLNLDSYDKRLKEAIDKANLIPIEQARDTNHHLNNGGTYKSVFPHGNCEGLAGTRFKLFGDCRMMHRGVITVKIIEPGITIFLIDARVGAEWLTADLIERPVGLKPLASEVGESCESRCEREKFICSAIDHFHVNNCAVAQGISGCLQCKATDSHRGSAVLSDPSVSQCLVSRKTGFFCREVLPNDRKSICPCVPRLPYLTFSHDVNYK